MLFWFFVIALTLSAVLSVVIPLRIRQRASVLDETHDREVYLDQLSELEREREEGRIGNDEAEAARAEIARRLITVDKSAAGVKPEGSSPWAVRLVAIAALAGIPVSALLAYQQTGSPGLPPQPLAARTNMPADHQDIRTLIARAEKHLAENPEDGRGWEVLGPIYMRMERFGEAATAFRNALRLAGPTSDRYASLGEAVLALEGGIVTREARQAFQRAADLDSGNIKARYYLALALRQEGKSDAAAAGFRKILDDSPPDAAWRPFVERALASVDPDAAPPGPTDDQIAAASQLSASEQAEMIEGMVSRLAERLEQEPDDPDGWVRLVRAYIVLERREDAVMAASKALENIEDSSSRTRIRERFSEMGLTPEETGAE